MADSVDATDTDARLLSSIFSIVILSFRHLGKNDYSKKKLYCLCTFLRLLRLLVLPVVSKCFMIYFMLYLLQSMPSNLKLICHISIIGFFIRFLVIFLCLLLLFVIYYVHSCLLLRSFVFVSNSQYLVSSSNILQECLVYNLSLFQNCVYVT